MPAQSRSPAANKNGGCIWEISVYNPVNHRNKRFFVSTANEALVGTLVPIGDVNDIFAIVLSPHFTAQLVVQFSVMLASALSLPCTLGAHSLKAISFLVEGLNGHKKEGRYVVPRSMVIHFPFFFSFFPNAKPHLLFEVFRIAWRCIPFPLPSGKAHLEK